METIEDQMNRLEEKIDTMYVSIEKVRKYLLTTLIITIITILLPILIAILIVPTILKTFEGMYGI